MVLQVRIVDCRRDEFRLIEFVDLTDTDDLTAQASALALRNPSTAVARVLGSAAGMFLLFLFDDFLTYSPTSHHQ